MLPAAYRLRRARDVDRVFRVGRVVSGRLVMLKILPNQLGQSRVAFLVGKKLAKSSVVRNRIKRRLREVFRLHIAALPPSTDLLVIARSPTLSCVDFAELTTDCLALLRKPVSSPPPLSRRADVSKKDV